MTEKFDYKSAGVDIDAGEEAVSKIKSLAKKTFGPEVLTELGGFGGLFAPDLKGYKNPVFVAGTDGVGTKLKLAFTLDKHDTVGEDLVAMCVNDIMAQGAKPLFFLDYLATGKLLPDKVKNIIAGVAEGCLKAGCALLGGETAEMPGFYSDGEYDLAGFTVGIVDKDNIIDGASIQEGDLLLGVASSGLHSNGYSLVRKVLLEHAGYQLSASVPGWDCLLGEELLKPTTIYVPYILPLISEYNIKGIAHITGGGITENLPRIIPSDLQAVIKLQSWQVPPVFTLIQKEGKISQEEMLRTFNMGLGLILAVPENMQGNIKAALAEKKLSSWQVGHVKKRPEGEGKLTYAGKDSH